MAGYLPYKVSKDGKTVSIGGKTYSTESFRRQFEISTGGTDKAEGRGAAVRRKDAPKTVKVTTNDGPEKPQTKAQQKANKKAIKELNKRGFGKMLTEKEAAKKRPMPPKATTRIGNLGRGGDILSTTLGAKLAYEQELARIAKAKRKENRMN